MPPVAPLAERSNFGAKLAAGKFVTGIELTPPRGFDLTKAVASAKLCRDAGIDVVNLPDGPRASARITPLACAAVIDSDLQFPPETLAEMYAVWRADEADIVEGREPKPPEINVQKKPTAPTLPQLDAEPLMDLDEEVF